MFVVGVGKDAIDTAGGGGRIVGEESESEARAVIRTHNSNSSAAAHALTMVLVMVVSLRTIATNQISNNEVNQQPNKNEETVISHALP